MITHPFSLLPSLNDSLLTDRFNQIDKLFSRLTGNDPVGQSPSYDIIQRGEGKYALTLSVPGYQESELSVSTRNGQLLIEGHHDDGRAGKDDDDNWLHRGISRSDFTLQFSIPRGTKVTGAKLANGLLDVELEHEIPEEEKLKKITIRRDEQPEQRKVIEHAASGQ